MINLDLNQAKFKTKQENGILKIYDPVRRKFVVFTPEELVRQTVLHFLIVEQKIPSSLVKVESLLRLFNTTKRTDIVIYNKNASPWMLVECKSFKNEIVSKDIEQALRYNLALNVPYLMVTNVKRVWLYKMDNHTNSSSLIDHFPDFAGQEN